LQQEFFFSLIQKLESQGMLENPVKLYDIATTATQSVTSTPAWGSISRLLSLAATLRRAGRQPGRRRAVTGMPDTRPSSKAGLARLGYQRPGLRCSRASPLPVSHLPLTRATPGPSAGVRDNQAVYAEDLAVCGLARTRLGRSVHDAGWGQLLRLVEEKAAHYGREFHRVGRFVPTSQLCSACGANDGPKPLSVRAWACLACGARHDRDVNAARNILAAGRADRLNACGGSVRPPSMVAAPGEAGTHRGAA
jgi:Putative transposase DNA-binding domain